MTLETYRKQSHLRKELERCTCIIHLFELQFLLMLEHVLLVKLNRMLLLRGTDMENLQRQIPVLMEARTADCLIATSIVARTASYRGVVLEQDAGPSPFSSSSPNNVILSSGKELVLMFCPLLMYPYCRIVLELFWCRIHTCVWNSLARLNDLGIC
ncbi:hypothetical protein DVH24_031170 [Malus domestica]|uniref:Uncharacterized protein n=1 Tax=Malus domestica TaxID=3750 RepID=A0A498HHJ1_MALDO|nr:hypothetical protein DVH24_031170 [Malus domestica]